MKVNQLANVLLFALAVACGCNRPATDSQLDRIRQEAESGNAEAQYKLGAAYFFGDGVPANTVEGVKWYRKAAEQGDKNAEMCLGIAYYNGDGINRDAAEAMKWYGKATGDTKAEAEIRILAMNFLLKKAKEGDVECQTQLAINYARGESLGKNDVEAIKWLRKAGDQGEEDDDGESHTTEGN